MAQASMRPGNGQPGSAAPGGGWRRIGWTMLIGPTIVLVILGAYLAVRFGSDTPVTYADDEEHFKYGSTGGEHDSGLPYWIFQALPKICPQYLPGPGYASLGLYFEEGHDLPVGMSKRRYMGIDRTFLNCAVCHTSTVRDSSASRPRLVLGMPANTFNIMAFQKFFFACAKDQKFSGEFIIPEVRSLLSQNHRLHPQAPADLDLIDRYLVYPVAISIMRERMLMLAGRFAWIDQQHDWGPGRVDTFNANKVMFNYPMHRLSEAELNAPADFPSIWNQQPRKEAQMQLHWDGNNTMFEERDKNAAFGTGTTPPTIDLKAIGRIENWILTKDAPRFPYPIDSAKAGRGAAVYRKYCSACHGAGRREATGPYDFTGADVGKVTPIDELRTDRHRLDSYTYELAVNQSTVYAGYPYRYTHFRKTFGYANLPLDGLWLRAPYLHNGSVPNLRELLQPASKRTPVFYRGNDVYDPVNVGFVSNVGKEGAQEYFKYDTRAPGNGNGGHEGERYGTYLAEADKDALVEYLKTF
jgi:processive rubber oxygenase RoxA-like protein